MPEKAMRESFGPSFVPMYPIHNRQIGKVFRLEKQTDFFLQVLEPPVDPHMQAVCDNIDAWAMWLSPPAFILFNVAYWLAYQNNRQEQPMTNSFSGINE